jgi:TonB-dependent receptor
LLVLSVLGAAFAQPAATGLVRGRVYNPATKEYVRDAEVRLGGTNQVAYTEADGTFQLFDVAPGEASITVAYTGYQTVTERVTVAAGQTAEREISLVRSLPGARTADGTVLLDAFNVTSEREGNAKAIMNQRRDMNIVTSVASDIFGDVTDGNVGEFLKYLPGVDLDYVESETRGPRLGGMEAQYVGVSFDGIKLASADANRTGDLGRATSFEAFSINSVESIEINRTASADMDASSPAGTINLKTRRAFDRKGRRLSYNFSVNLNSEQFTLDRTWGPDDREHYKARPNASLEYSDVFLNQRLGIVAGVSRANSYTEQYRHNMTYNKSPTAADPRPMVLTALNVKDGPKFILKDTYTVTADFKATPQLVLSASFIYNYALGEFYNRELTFTAANNNANGNNGRPSLLGDGVTTIRTNGAANNTVPNVALGGTNAAKETHTVTVVPKFEYKLRTWTFEGAATYSRSWNDYQAMERGFARSTGVNSAAGHFTATRANVQSGEWTIRQTSGADWLNLANFTNPSTTNEGRTARTEIWNADLSARWVTPLKRFPVVLKFGGKWNEENRLNGNDTPYQTWRYVGPGGNILAANGTITTAGSWAAYPTRHVFDTGTMNFVTFVNAAGTQAPIPRPDANAIAGLFRAHPEYFVNNATVENYYSAFIANRRDIRQTITAAYGMADVRLSTRLSLRAGLRWEGTENDSRQYNPLTIDDLRAAGIPFSTSTGRATTTSGIDYQFLSQPRVHRIADSARLFPSITGKYKVGANLEFQAGFNQAISRPPVDSISGVWVINENNFTITAPNAALKPEKSRNYQARVAYYFEPAGQFSLQVSANDVTNLRESHTFTAEEFGYGDDPEYSAYEFISTRNTDEKRQFRSMELGYSQSLTFLPEVFRGTTVNLSYTRGYANQRRGGLAPHRATGNIGYRLGKFSTRVGVVWHADTPWESTYGRYKRHTVKFDLGGEWRLTRTASVYFQGRNIFNDPQQWYESPTIEGQAGVLRIMENYGANWVFGVKGTF